MPELKFALADLDRPECVEVLSLMIFQTCPLAHVLQERGEPISRRVEDEQAAVLRRLLKIALEHGSAWRERAAAEFGLRPEVQPDA